MRAFTDSGIRDRFWRFCDETHAAISDPPNVTAKLNYYYSTITLRPVTYEFIRAIAPVEIAALIIKSRAIPEQLRKRTGHLVASALGACPVDLSMLPRTSRTQPHFRSYGKRFATK